MEETLKVRNFLISLSFEPSKTEGLKLGNSEGLEVNDEGLELFNI